MAFSFNDNIQYLFNAGIDVSGIKKAGYAARLAGGVRRAEKLGHAVPTRDALRGHPKAKPASSSKAPVSRTSKQPRFTRSENLRTIEKAGISTKGLKSDRTIARLASGVRRSEQEGLKKAPGKRVLYGKGNATYREFERKGHRLAQTVMRAKPAPGKPPVNQGNVPWVRTLQAEDLQQLLNLSHSTEDPILMVFVGWVTQYPGFNEPEEGDDDNPESWHSEIASIRIATSSVQKWIQEALHGSESFTLVDLINEHYGADKGAHWTQIDQVAIAYTKGEE